MATVEFVTPTVAAQPATPVSLFAPVDLAAMAFAPQDVTVSYFHDYFGILYPANSIPALGTGEPIPMGLTKLYQSFYFDPTQGKGLSVSMLAFESPEAAHAGTGIIAALLRAPLPFGTTIGQDSQAGVLLGVGGSALTLATYDTWSAGGPPVAVAAVSFQHGSFPAVLAAERWT